MADKQRKATAGDMIRSMAVIIVPILLITWLLTNNLGDYPVRAVTWRPVLQQARDAVEWPVQAPEGLPEQGDRAWIPTRVSFWKKGDPSTGGQTSPRNHWRLGLLSPDELYYEINQGDDQIEQLLRDTTRDGARVGEEVIEGTTWERWESADRRTRSLVLRTDSATTLVTADAPFTELQQFTRTLRAV